MTEPKHTQGELKCGKTAFGTPAIFAGDCNNAIALFGIYKQGEEPFEIENNKANAARLVQGWNLLNRLEDMGVSAEQVQQIIIAARSAEAVLTRIECTGEKPIANGQVLDHLRQALSKKV